MNKLAIDGGTPVFQQGELAKLVPAWPPAYPDTEQKLLEIYRSGKWGLCGQYEQLLMNDFAAFNEIYGKYFTSLPARSCVAVKTIPKGVLVEVEVIAESTLS